MNKDLLRSKYLAIFLLLIIFSLYDRALWSNISQWQVDEASTMWIGLTFSISEIPVGLISSQNIPNPNGMIFFSKLLSKFPTLWSSSYFLSFLQLLLIITLGIFLSKNDKKLFLLIILPLIFCLCLRSISTQMSNQWILTLVNILFFILISFYLNKPGINRLAFLVFPILIAPSIYLSGISNSIAYIFCIFLLVFFYPPKISKKEIIKPILIISLTTIIISYFVWFPYFENVIKNNLYLFQINQSINFKNVTNTIISFPYWSIFYAAGDISGTFKHNGLDTTTSPFWSIFNYDSQLLDELKKFYDGPLSNFSIYLLKINSVLLIVQSIISSILICLTIFFKRYFKILDKKIFFFICISYLFIFLVIFFGAIIGSPDWVHGRRLDMQVHLLPFFLIIWFLTPQIVKISSKFNTYFRFFSKFMLIFFVMINLLVGYLVYKDHLNYKGKILTDADIPLIQKEKVINFIASDWKRNSNKNLINVNYYFPDNRYSWVNKFGERYDKYYPGVYTRGREYDYILKKSHNLKNSQEGTQLRSFLNDGYIITYINSEMFIDKEKLKLSKEIGRLKIYKY